MTGDDDAVERVHTVHGNLGNAMAADSSSTDAMSNTRQQSMQLLHVPAQQEAVDNCNFGIVISSSQISSVSCPHQNNCVSIMSIPVSQSNVDALSFCSSQNTFATRWPSPHNASNHGYSGLLGDLDF